MLDIFKIQKLSQLSFKDKTGLSLYPWKNCKPRQSFTLTKPLSECKVAIVSSAGLYVRDLHEKFDHKVRGGDYTYRIISHDANLKHLADGQRSKSYDHSGIRQDTSTGMPIPQLNRLAEEGFIGRVNHRHFSVMGSILAPMRFIKNTIPEIVQHMKEDRVDVVLLIPF